MSTDKLATLIALLDWSIEPASWVCIRDLAHRVVELYSASTHTGLECGRGATAHGSGRTRSAPR